MLSTVYPKWLNFILFQAIWFVAILGQEKLAWLVALLLAAHFLLCRDRLMNELRVVLPCAAIGIAADALLTLAGVFVFEPTPSFLPVPFWLIGIWVGFAATFRHSFSYLMAKPLIAIPAAMVAAPFSYIAGMTLGAVSLGFDIPTTVVIIGLLWGGLMAAFIFIHRADASSSRGKLALI